MKNDKTLHYYLFAVVCLLILLTLSPAKCQSMQSSDGVVIISDGVNAEDGASIIGFYNRLPASLRQALSDGGYHYYAKTETSTGHHGTTWFNGYLNSTYSEGRAHKDVGFNGGIINHEIGHVADLMYTGYKPNSDPYSMFNASNTEEWKKLYDHYKTTIAGFGALSKYEVYNKYEAFAESYGHTINNRAMVLKKAPEIVAYIDKVNANIAATYRTASYNTPEVESLKGSAYNSEEFNAYTYYTRYADLQMAFGANDKALYEHWISYGRGEGRNPV